MLISKNEESNHVNILATNHNVDMWTMKEFGQLPGKALKENRDVVLLSLLYGIIYLVLKNHE